MNSREMDEYCKPILAALWDSTKCDELIVRAAEVVDKAIGSNFHRDNIRTEQTTKNVITECQKMMEARRRRPRDNPDSLPGRSPQLRVPRRTNCQQERRLQSKSDWFVRSLENPPEMCRSGTA